MKCARAAPPHSEIGFDALKSSLAWRSAAAAPSDSRPGIETIRTSACSAVADEEEQRPVSTEHQLEVWSTARGGPVSASATRCFAVGTRVHGRCERFSEYGGAWRRASGRRVGTATTWRAVEAVQAGSPRARRLHSSARRQFASRALVGEPDDDADAMLFLAALAFSPDRIALEPPATHDGWRVADATPRGTKLELRCGEAAEHGRVEAKLLRTSDPVGRVRPPHDQRGGARADGAARRAQRDGPHLCRPLARPARRAERRHGDRDRRRRDGGADARREVLALEHVKSGEVVHRAPGLPLPVEVAAPSTSCRRPRTCPASVPPTTHNQNSLNLNVPKNLRQLYSIGEDTVGKAPDNKMAVTASSGKYSSNGLHRSGPSTARNPGNSAQFCAILRNFLRRISPLRQVLRQGEPDVRQGRAEARRRRDDGQRRRRVDARHRDGDRRRGQRRGRVLGVRGALARQPRERALHEVDVRRVEHLRRRRAQAVLDVVRRGRESSWSFAAAQRLNGEFIKAGARGISLLYASGDEGANCKASKFVPEGRARRPTSPPSAAPSPLTASRRESDRAVERRLLRLLGAAGVAKDAVSRPAQPGLPDQATRGYNISGARTRTWPRRRPTSASRRLAAGSPAPRARRRPRRRGGAPQRRPPPGASRASSTSALRERRRAQRRHHGVVVGLRLLGRRLAGDGGLGRGDGAGHAQLRRPS